MSKPLSKPSTHSDQPTHVAGAPVPLICIDLEAKDTEEGLKVSFTQLRLRNARMDSYGTGYEVEMPKSKKSNDWTVGLVSRRRFGLDNFSLDVSMTQSHFASSSEAGSGIAPKVKHISCAGISARVWVWEKDKELAVAALNETLADTMTRLRSKTVDIQGALASCALEEEPTPVKKSTSKPK